ncbi:queuosine 5'-phosphate N-glycosylase/hydrolase [Dermatophagoides farinae]|uniref:queuosine 5'-phosphate N-glycosylase/hydrolase n=1 Tax=Dermatophagoides farinae TaxID=6954 RepID=UPI003F62FA31
MDMLPKESAEFVMSVADHVTINTNAVKELATKLKESVALNEYDLKKWKSDNPLHPQEMIDKSIDQIFFIDSLNFSFWPDENQDFSIEGEIGYWALCAAVKRALDEKIPLTNSEYYSHMELQQLRYLFRTDNGIDIPMLKERVSILNENGAILMKHFNGSFVNCIRAINCSAINLLKLIYEYFPSFRDEVIYKGKNVTFLKRAQILIADIWGCFEGKGLGRFDDIDQLTMFADYRIPQVLHYFGVLKYSTILAEKLQENNLLVNGHPFEVEIRSSSIHAIEMVREQLSSMIDDDLKAPNSIQIDFYLWGYRRTNSEQIDGQRSPFHRVRCIYY